MKKISWLLILLFIPLRGSNIIDSANEQLHRLPSEYVFDLLYSEKEYIESISKHFDISEIAIGGVLLAEHSLNVNYFDIAQDYLLKNEMGDFPFTYGLGQMSLNALNQSEIFASSFEHRKRKDKSELRKEMLTPRGALYYIASYLKWCEVVYKSNGFDISNRPEILATLYNIGDVKFRAYQKKVLKNDAFYPNIFGMYVKKHEKLLSQILLKDITFIR